MDTFFIRDNDWNLTEIDAESYENAANRYVHSAHREYNAKGGHARRTTGDPNKSGWFRPYYRRMDSRGATEHAFGEPFHVSPA